MADLTLESRVLLGVIAKSALAYPEAEAGGLYPSSARNKELVLQPRLIRDLELQEAL